MLEQLVGAAGGLVEPWYFPLCVKKRSWTRACAPFWWSALLMAAWTHAFLLARSSLVLPLPNWEGRVKSRGSSNHRCSGLQTFVVGPFEGLFLFSTTVHCPPVAAAA